jgi:hypothetical protein
MKMIFRISYFSIETGEPRLKFASTLSAARKFVAECKDGKNFKITPINLK